MIKNPKNFGKSAELSILKHLKKTARHDTDHESVSADERLNMLPSNTPPKKRGHTLMSTTKLTLTAQVVIAMLLGITVGLLINVSGLNAAGSFVNEYIVNGLFKAVGTLFVNALKMLVVPLVLFSLICGVCGIGNLNTLGRVGAKSFVLYLLTTAIAVATAVIFGVTAGIGQGMQASTASTFTGKEAPPLLDVFTNYQQDA